MVVQEKGNFDGFETLLTADSDVNDVTAGTVTSTNVITELGKIVDAIPSAVYGKDDLTIYVSSNIARAYIRALGGFVATIGANRCLITKVHNGMDGGQNCLSMGINIFVAKGLADNTAVAAQKSNLFFGTGLLDDRNEVKVIDMADIDGSQNVRVVMRYTAGVQFGIGG